eukprot:TRINITY_DN3670_c0_g1_i1.p1 TRINITY_DN3670_c0_g1~~TRINITY_DN3670_c0_g1_i1.p1  ORF type:complete len:558 (+),score=260.47 TRINITY_DN3670_c0_g1_i1:85-1674(+)
MAVIQSLKGQIQLGQRPDLAALQAENAEIKQMILAACPQITPAKLEELIQAKVSHHARLRMAMESPVTAVPRGPTAAMADPTAGQRPVTDWGGRWKKVGEMMKCERGSMRDQMIPVQFGKNMRFLYFCLDENFLNAASYGATPRPVMEAREQWDRLIQRNPAAWRFKVPGVMKELETKLANMIGAHPDDTKVLINANAATSTILKSLPWEVGDRIFMLSIDYDATKHAAEWLTRTKGVEVVELGVKLPITDEALLAQIEDKLKELQTTNPPMPKLANFCHVTSKSARIFPAKAMTQLFHKYNIRVIIDGAQAAGHLDINVNDIGADWYLGTVHKWLYSCQGVAFLCTHPSKQACTSPLTVSPFHGEGYEKEFMYQGLMDYPTWYSTHEAFDFINNVCGGMGAVRKYCREQAQRAVAILSAAWGTQPVQGSPELYGNMPIMPVPNGKGVENAVAAKIMGYLTMKCGTTAFLLVDEYDGSKTCCIRCSCQIYTDDDDWKRLAENVNKLKGNYGPLNVLSELLPDAIASASS